MLGIAGATLAGMTAYAYAGYPLAVAALARRMPAEGPYEPSEPTVSVVIAAFNERSVIAAKIDNVLALDYPADKLELIVVTDGSTDGTAAVARDAAPGLARVLHSDRRAGKAAALGRGVAVASGEIVVFSDANNMYPDDALRQVLLPLSDPDVGAVTGAKTVSGGAEQLVGGERAYWRYESFIKSQESRLGCCTAVIGELLAVRRELVPELPTGLVNDDFFIAMQVARAGKRVAYAPLARSMESSAQSLRDDGTRRRRMTAGRWQALAWWRRTVPMDRPQVVWQVASHKYLRLLLPFTMAGSLAAAGCDVALGRATRLRRTRMAFFAAQATFYGCAATGPALRAIPVLRAVPGLRAISGLSRYLVVSNAASARGLAYYVRHRDALHLWERVERDPGPQHGSPAREPVG